MGKLLYTLEIIFALTACSVFPTLAGPASDPCAGAICGKGAECRFQSSLVVCVCPDSMEGDPFVECKASSTTTESMMQEALDISTMANQELMKLSPDSNLNPTGQSMKNGDLEQDKGDLSSYYPSAPPTLSHYAHTPPFSQPPYSEPPSSAPPTSQNHGPHPIHHQSRQDSHSPQGTINHDFAHEPKAEPKIEVSQHQMTVAEVGGTGFQIPENFGSRFPVPSDRDSERVEHRVSSGHIMHRQGVHHPLQHHIPQNAQHSSGHQHNNPKISNSHHHFNPNLPNTHFNPNQEAPNLQFQELTKDPLGVYVDCVSINNRVVCADSAARHDLHPHALHTMALPQGFEHRLIAIGNENVNNFPHGPPPRLDGFPNSMKIKPKPTQMHPGDDRPHFQVPFHIAGPQGTVNMLPVPVISVPVDSPQEVVKVKPEPETKFHSPQTGSEEAKLCQQMCGEGAICRLFHGRPVCGCSEGMTGDPSKKCFPEPNSKFDPNACQRHADCSSLMICLNSQCTDPCRIKNNVDKSNISSFHDSLDAVTNKNDNLCGPNAKCSVIEHTPLCSCEQNFFGNPYVGCVP